MLCWIIGKKVRNNHRLVMKIILVQLFQVLVKFKEQIIKGIIQEIGSYLLDLLQKKRFYSIWLFKRSNIESDYYLYYKHTLACYREHVIISFFLLLYCLFKLIKGKPICVLLLHA